MKSMKWQLTIDNDKVEKFTTYEGAQSRLDYLANARTKMGEYDFVRTHASLWLTKVGR